MAEAAAMKWGMHVALRARGSSVLLESDCLEVVELVNSRCSSMAEISWMISEILEMKNSFQNFRAQHIARIYNGATHALAKLALQKMTDMIWLDEFPMCCI